jgi:hypothetical protein
MDNNQDSRGAQHANTNKFQQKHAFGIPLRPKVAGEAISEGED